jgi:signal transduction histidine kinase
VNSPERDRLAGVAALSVEHVYAPSVEAIGAARRLCIDYLQQVLLGEREDIEVILDDARLIVSELVTNAIQAETTEVRVCVAAGTDYVRIGVSDTALGTPVSQQQTPSSARGRGLWIVEQIAKRCGTTNLSTGKQVWAEVAIRDGVICLS